jgi:hypothetical protein
MINFGNVFLSILAIGTLTSNAILSADLTFEISSNEIRAGDVLILEVKYKGEKELKPTQTKYDSKGVQVYYIGNSYETQIINFKVSRSHVLKYQVSSNNIGKHKIPTINVLLDGQLFESPEIYFAVTKKLNKPPNAPSSNFFDHIFGGQDNIETSSVPPEVVFHTNKNQVYLGEPIVGYYVLYYNGLKAPYFERDPNQSISFPFFLAETLNQVTVQIDPTVERNSIDRSTLVYSKEVYGLTPLRVGTFSLGATNFVVGDSLRFGALHDSLPAITQSIRVQPLPAGSPPNFKGAIGDYELTFHSTKQKIHLGESYYFSIRIAGSGAGFGFNDPFSTDGIANIEELHLIKKEKSKVFKKLPDGQFGFHSTIKFYYSFEPKSEGSHDLPSARISFFSPRTLTYEERSISISPVFIHPKRSQVESNSLEPTVGAVSSTKYIFWCGLLMVTFASIFGAHVFYTKKIKIRESMNSLNGKIGTKKGEILLDYLVRHGVSDSNARVFTDLSHAFPNQNWNQIYTFCGKHDRQILIKTSIQLNK